VAVAKADALEPKRLLWKRAVKLAATIFPPVPLFEDVADPDDFDAIAALIARTHPATDPSACFAWQVPSEDRALGPGAAYVMAPFAYISPSGTRFGPPALSGAPYGVFYSARDEATSIAEVKHHRTAFLKATAAPSQDLDYEVLNSVVKGSVFYDIRGRHQDFRDVYSASEYGASQKLAAQLRAKGADGIAYDSVRREGGECVAVFRPRCVTQCRPVKQLIFRWDGESIAAVLEARPIQ
jgi:RES domain